MDHSHGSIGRMVHSPKGRADARPPGSPGTLHGVAGKHSAGLLVYRRTAAGAEVLLGHLGGPFWQRRDAGAWSVPKGEFVPPEEAVAAARREFEEELGLPPPEGELVELGTARQPGGKLVTVWAVEGDLDPATVVPGTFQLEWPRGSGTLCEFPEIDRVAWFDLTQAAGKLVAGQRVFLDHLANHLTPPPAPPPSPRSPSPPRRFRADGPSAR